MRFVASKSATHFKSRPNEYTTAMRSVIEYFGLVNNTANGLARCVVEHGVPPSTIRVLSETSVEKCLYVEGMEREFQKEVKQLIEDERSLQG